MSLADMQNKWCVRSEALPSGTVRWFVDLGQHKKKRAKIGTVPSRITGQKEPLRSKAQAEEVLNAARNAAAQGYTLDQILADLKGGVSDADLIRNRLDRKDGYLAAVRDLTAQEERSTTSLREIERYARLDGTHGNHWSWWFNRSVVGITPGDVDDWHRWLGNRIVQRGPRKGQPLTPKMRQNVSVQFRAFLNYEARHDPHRVLVPDWPAIKQVDYDPETMQPEQVVEAFDCIPWEERGLFLCCYCMIVRLSEARAYDVEDYDAVAGTLRLKKAIQGPLVTSRIVGKNKTGRDRRVPVGDPVFRTWLDWRVANLTAEEKIRGGMVPLFTSPRARDRAKRWTPNSVDNRWKQACQDAGYPPIRFQHATRHSAISALAPHMSDRELLAVTGHRDRRSLDRYVDLRPNVSKAAAILRPNFGRGNEDDAESDDGR